MKTRIIEGIHYHRYVITYRDNGRRVRLIRWSVGRPWLDDGIARELTERDVPAGTTVRIRQEDT